METFASDTFSIDYSKAPSFTENFFTEVNPRIIETPQMKVNISGKFNDFQTSLFIEKWEENSTIPVFGPKDGEFIVFYEKGLEKHVIIDYFMQLSHAYSLLGFGKMIPFSQSSFANECETKKAFSCAEKFYDENKIVFSRETRVICYIITKSVPDSLFSETKKQFGIRWLLSDDVDGAIDEDYKEEAFKLYSLIRKRLPAPVSEIFQNRTCKLPDFLFGFRYQHPFLVKRARPEMMTIHIFINPQNENSIWTDDSGSTLARLNSATPSLVRECINEIRQLCATTTIILRFNVTVVSEYVDETLLNNLRSEIGSEASIFSLFPAPFVQTKFSNGLTEDVFVESPYEMSDFPLKERRRFGAHTVTRAAKHISSGFVISNGLQTYQVGILSCTQDQDPRFALENYVNQVSALSWMTMKPNFQKRTTSLPPPVAMLLNESEQSTATYSRVSFSTQLEKCK